ncbi:hypothetical protein BJF85_01755 [Saccharomonospora sp. CUA-673]|uniref:VC0807 family protein n=1 Tax=Saccharomonospora sp. CUA-673 TaxID=1904969 RepID=UPI00095EC858|nr:VC0807 family protein [Saccharomonospora sp. CUA-673]OLT45158.1 hypothetical protein BJF85_01755 [Saccharomonospora sp. CUA-673]
MTGDSQRVPPLVRSIAWDVGGPLAAYYGLRAVGVPDLQALLAGALLAAARVVWSIVRSRTFNAFACLMAVILGIGLALTFVSGDSRFLLMKESLATGAAGIILLASCAGRSPLILTVVREGATPSRRDEIDRLCAEIPTFRRAFTRMTVVWGVALLTEAVLRVPLVYLLPVDAMVVLSIVLLGAVVTALSVWTAWYADRVHKRHALEEHSDPARD